MEIRRSARPVKTNTSVGEGNRARRVKEILAAANYGDKHFDSVLDAGCGYGDITLGLSNRYKITGVDPYNKCIEDANSTRKSLELPCNFIQASAEKLCFKNDVFDLVISYNVLEHVDHQKEMIKEFSRVLNPGGVLFLCVPNRYWILESHYRLPFLSWLPRSLADQAVRLAGKNDRYDAYPPSWWQLNRLLSDYFYVTDMSCFVLKNISKLYEGPEYHNRFKYYGALVLSNMPAQLLRIFGIMFTEAFIVVCRVKKVTI